jgi:hypothetical protein
MTLHLPKLFPGRKSGVWAHEETPEGQKTQRAAWLEQSGNAGAVKHAARDVLPCWAMARINHRVEGKDQGEALWPLLSAATDLPTMCLPVQVSDLLKMLTI